jgi:dihydroneopterin aldolase
MSDAVTLDCELTCILGILSRERVDPQILRASFELELDLDPTCTSGELAGSINYADVDGMFRTLAGRGGFLLLETMGLAALRWVLLPPGPGEARGHVERATLHLTKPEVMPQALPGVRLTRTSHDLPVPSRTLAKGVTARVLADLDEVTALRVEVQDGYSWSPPVGAAVFPEGSVVVSGPATVLCVEARPHPGLVEG